VSYSAIVSAAIFREFTSEHQIWKFLIEKSPSSKPISKKKKKKKKLFQFCDIEFFAKFSQKKKREKKEEKLAEFTLQNTPQKNSQLF